MYNQVTVIGVGLIGGSMALALKDNNLAKEVVGVESNAENARTAVELGLVDRVLPLEEAVEGSELIVIATPVSAAPIIAVKVLNLLKKLNQTSSVVMDMGSTKEELCSVIELHPLRGRFVASHPMWGTEFSGPRAAQKGAFVGKVAVLCQKELSDNDAAESVEGVYKELNMRLLYMNPEEHDTHTAYVSHISHLTSFALALTVLEKEREENHIFDLAAAGFESTVRLAKSPASMWIPIFLKNKYNVLDVLRENIHQLQIIRKMIEQDDAEGLLKAITKANEIGKILK